MKKENIERLEIVIKNQPIINPPPVTFIPDLNDILSARIIKNKLIGGGIPPVIFFEENRYTTKWLEDLQKKYSNWEKILRFLLSWTATKSRINIILSGFFLIQIIKQTIYFIVNFF